MLQIQVSKDLKVLIVVNLNTGEVMLTLKMRPAATKSVNQAMQDLSSFITEPTEDLIPLMLIWFGKKQVADIYALIWILDALDKNGEQIISEAVSEMSSLYGSRAVARWIADVEPEVLSGTIRHILYSGLAGKKISYDFLRA